MIHGERNRRSDDDVDGVEVLIVIDRIFLSRQPLKIIDKSPPHS